MPPQYVFSSACILFRVYFSLCVILFACMSLHLHSPLYVCLYCVWAFMYSYPSYTYMSFRKYVSSVYMSRPRVCALCIYISILVIPSFVCCLQIYMFCLHVSSVYMSSLHAPLWVCSLGLCLHYFGCWGTFSGVHTQTHAYWVIEIYLFFYQFHACIVVTLSSVDCPFFLIHSIIFLGK